ncbi:MAG: cyclodeaminase/cyclohydrolase family protein [Tepidisphaeraceae bacterium]
MLDKTTTIEKFLDAAAAKQPTPGGGSAAALAGALAAAMGEMVLNYSLGKKGLEIHAEALKAALAEFRRAREIMVELMAEDQSAYEALAAARKGADLAKRQQAVMICARVPQTIAGTAVAILELADELVEKVNQRLLSDLAVCAELAMASTRAALYNVQVNLPDVADVQNRRKIEEECQRMLSHAASRIKRVIPRIWERASEG